MKRILGALTFAVLALGLLGGTARAQDRDDRWERPVMVDRGDDAPRYWRAREWRDEQRDQRREREWREHAWRRDDRGERWEWMRRQDGGWRR